MRLYTVFLQCYNLRSVLRIVNTLVRVVSATVGMNVSWCRPW